MMPLKPTTDHPSTHITTQAELQPQPAGVRRDLPLHGIAEVDDVADAARFPLAQHHEQLLIGPARLGLAKVQRYPQPGDGVGGLERGLQRPDAAPERVAAQVDADDALGMEPAGQVHDLCCLLGGVAAVHGEDQAGVEPGRGRASGGLLELADGRQDGLDVARLGQAGLWQGARRGPQLEVDDAVCGEVVEHGEGCVAQGGEVVYEVVDVGGEEGEEPFFFWF